MTAASGPRRLGDLAEFVGGRVVGDPDLMIHGVASIEAARRNDITFATNEKFLQEAFASAAACVIVALDVITDTGKTLLQTDNPRFAFARIAGLFAPPQRLIPGIHASAVVAPGAKTGRDVAIGPNAVVDEGAVLGDNVVLFPGVYVGKNAHIGEGTIIHANVTIEQEVRIGAHCIIHAGTVIGSDGFGFVENARKHYKIPQIGNVIIEDNVEIGSNCCVDRATSDSTIIRSGTKIDNLVHIAHNVVIGHDCLIVAQVGISGSVTVGNSVTLAGQVGIAGHLTIGDRTVVAAKSGVTKSIIGGVHVSGFPAKPHRDELNILANIQNLPSTVDKVNQLVTAVQRLGRRIDKFEGGDRS